MALTKSRYESPKQALAALVVLQGLAWETHTVSSLKLCVIRNHTS